MCKSKPGPRCSADTLASLTSLEEKKKTLEQKFIDVEREFPSEEYNYDLDTPPSDLVRVEIAEVEKKIEEAQLNYNSTPKGIQSLELKLDVRGSYLTKQPMGEISANDFPWGAAVARREAAKIPVEMPEGLKISVDLHAAQNHRKWQTGISNELQKAEEKNLGAVGFVANSLRKNLAEKLDEEKSALQEYHYGEYTDAVKTYRASPTPINHQAAIDAFHTSYKKQRNIAYAEIKLNDMNDYIEALEKKAVTTTQKVDPFESLVF